MTTSRLPINPGICNNTALRKAARRLTRFYDACMADTGLRATQYAILNLLASRGPTTMAALADLLSMDRATMGHNLRPLERDGLVIIQIGREDRREREVVLSSVGLNIEARSKPSWLKAQASFEKEFGKQDALAMRRMMARVTHLELDPEEATS
ncbi:MarR family winged helix-turn-helix transcriptional regulator [Burkholderia sp. S171]|uniref:MarR family winged helix-turn-helix transcriptional regulator n=1 Tax=Burkholderia sp. S171 TaxID=1641860 RepID=UPI00131B576D|nr:MarR family winged helix-turn-helix transcriptional regulator [Burkholderia sp. S171]